MTETLRIATRGSQLALQQARIVADALERRRREVELVTVETTGDQLRDELIHQLGKTGAFVRNLDEKVLDGEVDAAVHSMKDMPTDMPDDLIVAAIPPRADADDVLVTPGGSTLGELPDGAIVGTSSLRRKAQLLAARPDLEVEPIRGNVDTRVQKLLASTLQADHETRMDAEESDTTEFEQSVDEWFDSLSELERQALGREVDTAYDAIVLAAAGLERIDLLEEARIHRFGATFVPAPGQGAIAVTALDGSLADHIHDVVDHPRSRVETTVERTILSTLGGGCVAPVGIGAVLQGEYVRTRVRVLSQDGTEEISTTRDLPVERHPDAARELAEDLAEDGARDLIQAARRDGT
ncbi:MAG: hydroxymethylbilane synthase [Natronomonas sp.]